MSDVTWLRRHCDLDNGAEPGYPLHAAYDISSESRTRYGESTRGGFQWYSGARVFLPGIIFQPAYLFNYWNPRPK